MNLLQSRDSCSFKQFEAKAKEFEKSILKKSGKKKKKDFSELEIETLYWKACFDKPLLIECANCIPGSGFVPINGKKLREAGEASTVGETPWNMRGVSRANGSLLKFMKEEIPGVTSPMVYLAMMFSSFAWHVEDYELHSLNYIHLGAAKTWYAVPKDAAVAFEEVVRVHGYGGEVNPLVTCASLAEKTTLMSPEVLVGAGIPCCRLVQNAGEFVVTFPRAYHSGFSHGFNCSEAANIATPEWLMVAKEAAVRRASINYSPVVSHLQLLYSLALSFCSRIPLSISTEPRSSRLKEKKKSEGETKVKERFVESVIQNNEFLHDLLEQGSSCVLLPKNSLDIICPNVSPGSQVEIYPRFSVGAFSPEEEMERLENTVLDEIMVDKNTQNRELNGFRSMKQYSSCVRKGNRPPSLSVKNPQNDNADFRTYPSERRNTNTEKECASQTDGLLDHEMLSCLTCGILSCACVAVVQPREEASKYIVSADCSLFNDWIVASGAPDNEYSNADRFANTSELNSCSGQVEKSDYNDVNDVTVQCSSYQAEVLNGRVEVNPDIDAQKAISSLNLLAAAYGNLSDSDDEKAESEMPVSGDENDTVYNQKDRSRSSDETFSSARTFACASSVDPGHHDDRMKSMFHSSSSIGGGSEFSSQISWCPSACSRTHVRATANGRYEQNLENSLQNKLVSTIPKVSNCLSLERSACDHADLSTKSTTLDSMPNCYPGLSSARNNCCSLDIPTKDIQIPFKQRSGEDSSKGHMFCLEHAVEIEKQLRTVGGVHVLLVCHPDYPRVETEAKVLAEELGINYIWKHIPYREATKDEAARIQSSLGDKEAVPRNGDWTVKLGINLPYNASISQSPFYRKKMPYSIVSKVFGCSSPTNSSEKPKIFGKRPGVNNKIVVAGRWCGKVWMSDQVHPYLAQRACQKEETSASIHSQATSEAKVKIEIKPELSDESEQTSTSQWKSLRTLTTTVTRKTDKKRKGTLKKGATKKRKCSQPDSPIEAVEDSPTHDSPPRCRRILRTGQANQKTLPISKKRKCSQPDSPIEAVEDSPTHDSPPRCRRNLRTGQAKRKEEAAGGRGKRLKKKSYKLLEDEDVKPIKQAKKKITKKASTCSEDKIIKDEEQEYQCDIENCTMVFRSKQDLKLHKRNICLVEGCDKKFLSHRYLEQHERVHMDDRPLKCPWKGCRMSFKWAWARTEHIRVHTGVRPYECQEPGCGQTFRFVTDFSRHRRKTGHSVKKVVDD
ncbi:hypothetical protein AQUCO_05600083v1 [Aquilegia coerulea]|uniref:JmjC domain-containing protein n=1 Tax=Aquilegia coerulea TaxID=218851 RepID=A0A2G5CHS9_AQUCA|nr:hypothetical protein AQUCO_05600083v1 [Aquilegia coerulea]